MPRSIVAQMSPSPEQKPAILSRGHDVVVTAGAGTGKTRTLVARYLSLLAEGEPLRGIVAITFTIKAAREMRNRVRDEVRKHLELTDLTPEEQRRWQALYSGLDAARISTIHSLCAEILRAHPAEARVDPRFEVLDEGQLNILQQRALDAGMAWAADEEDAVELFAQLGESGLRSTLATLLANRLDVEPILAAIPDQLWPVWESILVPPLRAFTDDERVRANFAELLELRDDGTLDRAEAAGDALAFPLRHLLAAWDQILAARAADDWPAISVRLLPLRAEMKLVGRASNWEPSQPKVNLRELRDAFDASLAGLVGSKGVNLTLDKQFAQAMPALRSLFVRTCATYAQLKADRRALDFDDLEAQALDLLERNGSVRQRWQSDIAALLVDEFQDTNGRQRDLVKLLNGDGGKLFIVGDAKQSIYRFRGADVTVFRVERERLEGAGGAVYALDTSYRAHQELVMGLNDLLRPILGDSPDPERPWAEPFSPLLHYRENAGPGFAAPHIELHLTIGSKAGGALVRAADALSGRIQELIDAGVSLVDDGRSRPLDYGDVAILCRASHSFGAYEGALERAGIPFLTVAGRGFFGRPEIRDLLNALQAIGDPTDDLALAGLLRSPAFALTDAALYWMCLAQSQVGNDAIRTQKRTLWDVLRTDGHALPLEDGPRTERAVRIITELNRGAGRTPVADLLKALLDATDYRAALIQSGGMRGARNVSKLLSDAHASGIVAIGEFLEYVGGLRDSGTREGEARATAEGAVQIMTIHAAKGLEFPVVVIGDASSASWAAKGVLLDPELGPLVALQDGEGRASGVYRLGKEREEDQTAAESDRLLYVAATRAREKLIFSGCMSLKQDNTIGSVGGWLGQIAADEVLGLVGRAILYDDNGAEAYRTTLHAGQTPVSVAVYEPGYSSAVQSLQAKPELAQPALFPPVLLAPVTVAPVPAGGDAAVQRTAPHQRVWRVVPAVRRPRAPAWVVGSVVHEALAAWRFPVDDHTFQPWAEARTRGYGITDERQIRDAARRCGRMLRRFQAHPLYQEMASAEIRLHEVPYSMPLAVGPAGGEMRERHPTPAAGTVESGVIDAVYLWNGVWNIVEFKTDAVRDDAAFAKLLADEDYVNQAVGYTAAVERLLGVRPRCVLCMLNYAGSVRLFPVTDAAVG